MSETDENEFQKRRKARRAEAQRLAQLASEELDKALAEAQELASMINKALDDDGVDTIDCRVKNAAVRLEAGRSQLWIRQHEDIYLVEDGRGNSSRLDRDSMFDAVDDWIERHRKPGG